jgi:hypothetical protein
MNRKFSTIAWLLLTAAATLCAVAPAKAAEKKPNIVFMLMDASPTGRATFPPNQMRVSPCPC